MGFDLRPKCLAACNNAQYHSSPNYHPLDPNLPDPESLRKFNQQMKQHQKKKYLQPDPFIIVYFIVMHVAIIDNYCQLLSIIVNNCQLLPHA